MIRVAGRARPGRYSWSSWPGFRSRRVRIGRHSIRPRRYVACRPVFEGRRDKLRNGLRIVAPVARHGSDLVADSAVQTGFCNPFTAAKRDGWISHCAARAAKRLARRRIRSTRAERRMAANRTASIRPWPMTPVQLAVVQRARALVRPGLTKGSGPPALHQDFGGLCVSQPAQAPAARTSAAVSCPARFGSVGLIDPRPIASALASPATCPARPPD